MPTINVARVPTDMTSLRFTIAPLLGAMLMEPPSSQGPLMAEKRDPRRVSAKIELRAGPDDRVGDWLAG